MWLFNNQLPQKTSNNIGKKKEQKLWSIPILLFWAQWPYCHGGKVPEEPEQGVPLGVNECRASRSANDSKKQR